MRPSNRIFICYRREDSGGYAGRLYDQLAEHFGHDRVFMDIDAIEPGADFVEVADAAVATSEAVLIVIGPNWLSATARGVRRLDSPDDYVRQEIMSALANQRLVIPVLVGGAAMPSTSELPEAISGLARRNALTMSDLRWKTDVQTLVQALEARTTRTSKSQDVENAGTVTTEASIQRRRRYQQAGLGALVGVVVVVALVINYWVNYASHPNLGGNNPGATISPQLTSSPTHSSTPTKTVAQGVPNVYGLDKNAALTMLSDADYPARAINVCSGSVAANRVRQVLTDIGAPDGTILVDASGVTAAGRTLPTGTNVVVKISTGVSCG